jgi:hypothetical protein
MPTLRVRMEDPNLGCLRIFDACGEQLGTSLKRKDILTLAQKNLGLLIFGGYSAFYDRISF